MENQHRKISGYRELSQQEIDLMNEIKALGPLIEGVYLKIEEHLLQQHTNKLDAVESLRLKEASPFVWANSAKKDLQTGLMALTRAVAQPTFF